MDTYTATLSALLNLSTMRSNQVQLLILPSRLHPNVTHWLLIGSAVQFCGQVASLTVSLEMSI